MTRRPPRCVRSAARRPGPARSSPSLHQAASTETSGSSSGRRSAPRASCPCARLPRPSGSRAGERLTPSTPVLAAPRPPRAERSTRPPARRRRNGSTTWNPPLVRFVSHHTTMQPPPVKIRPLVAERKLSRRLFEQLAEQIKGGRLTPGARLPTEQELTRAARVSRTVVREAVAALRAEGLVVTRQGVGAFVPENARRPFRIDFHGLSSLPEVIEVMELRTGIEIEAAGLAAERASAAQVRRIVECL